MSKKGPLIIIPGGISPFPSRAELTAAYILRDHFQADVEFVLRDNCKTPDFLINHTSWELKTPTGNGKRNLQHTISRALKQSQNIVVDARFSKIHIAKIKSRLTNELNKNKQIKRLIVIDKQKRVIEISRTL